MSSLQIACLEFKEVTCLFELHGINRYLTWTRQANGVLTFGWKKHYCKLYFQYFKCYILVYWKKNSYMCSYIVTYLYNYIVLYLQLIDIKGYTMHTKHVYANVQFVFFLNAVWFYLFNLLHASWWKQLFWSITELEFLKALKFKHI